MKINFKDEFYTQLKSLVIPIAFQNFMLALVSATDAVMLGALSQDSMAAASLAGQIQFILNLFVAGITGGMAVMIAQYWGKGDGKTIGKIIPIALRINVIAGALFTACALIIPEYLMRIFTNDDALITIGGDYLFAVAFSYVLCAVSQIYLTILKNTGYTRISSRISSSAVLVNIIANAVLIFGLLGVPALGVQGAAYATTIARVFELVWAFVETEKPERIRIQWNHFFVSAGKELNKDFVQYSIPVLIAAMVWGIAFSMYSVVMGHLGADVVAANSIASISKSLISCVAHGLSAGTGIMVGNLLGAGEIAKAKEYGNRLVRLSAVVGAIIGSILIAISPIITRLSNVNDQTAHYLQFMLIMCGFNLAAQSINTVTLDGVACAGGDALFDVKGNIFAMWLFGVPLSFLAAFVFKWPVMVVYVIANLDEIVKLPFMLKHHVKYVWLKDITR